VGAEADAAGVELWLEVLAELVAPEEPEVATSEPLPAAVVAVKPLLV